MLISHRHKFIFFSQGKAASSTIENLLYTYNDDARVRLVRYKQTKARKGAGYTSYGVKGRFYGKRPYKGKRATEHAVPCLVKPQLCNIYDEYFKIGFVRNPWDWVVSCHDFNKASNKEIILDAQSVIRTARLMKKFRKGLTASTHYQYAFLSDRPDGSGSIDMDYVGKVETLKYDLDSICGQLDLSVTSDIPFANTRANKRLSYKERFTHSGVEQVYKIYRKDIEYFGYTFD